MPSKEWILQFGEHEIVMNNYWTFPGVRKEMTGTAKLYIDGDCVDTCTDEITTFSRPCLRGKIDNNGQRHVIEGYLSSRLTGIKGKIVVDGIERPTRTR